MAGVTGYRRRWMKRTRPAMPVRWHAEDGRLMRFHVVMHVCDVWRELFWGDYVPEDGETWDVLRSLPRA
jgi:hypothetical protein